MKVSLKALRPPVHAFLLSQAGVICQWIRQGSRCGRNGRLNMTLHSGLPRHDSASLGKSGVGGQHGTA